jgi:hypothetical protein
VVTDGCRWLPILLVDKERTKRGPDC